MMKREKIDFSINRRIISSKRSPYIIAEISANHNGSIKRALKTIKAAKNAGVDAVKIQTYTPDTMTINKSTSDFTLKEGPYTDERILNKTGYNPENVTIKDVTMKEIE